MRINCNVQAAALAFLIFCLAVFNASAQVANVSLGLKQSFSSGASIEVQIPVGSAISAGGTLTLTGIFGDLNGLDERVTVSADGVVIGSFGGFGGTDCEARPDQTFNIPQAALAPLSNTGVLTLNFSASGTVDVCGPGLPSLSFSGVVSLGGQLTTEVQSKLAITGNFVRRRADRIVSVGPNVSQFHARLAGPSSGGPGSQNSHKNSEEASAGLNGLALMNPPGRLPGLLNETASQNRTFAAPADRTSAGLNQLRKVQPFTFSGSDFSGSGQHSFYTSLSLINKAALAQQASKLAALGVASGPGETGNSAVKIPPANLAFDIWAQAEFTYFRDDIGGGDRKGHTGLVYVGADYVLTPSVIVGTLVQFDFSEDESSVLGTRTDGNGWMAGPYVSARIARNVFLDLHASWGRSDNDSIPGGSTTDSFDTRRRLLSASLTGNWHSGATRLTPTLTVKHFSETQESYLSGSGAFVPSQKVELGRFAFGAELGHTFHGPNKVTFEPHVSLQGIWDFAGDDTVSVGGLVVNTQKARGKIGGGLRVTAASGVSVRTSAAYDGLGDKDFDAYQGQVFVVVPFN